MKSKDYPKLAFSNPSLKESYEHIHKCKLDLEDAKRQYLDMEMVLLGKNSSDLNTDNYIRGLGKVIRWCKENDITFSEHNNDYLIFETIFGRYMIQECYAERDNVNVSLIIGSNNKRYDDFTVRYDVEYQNIPYYDVIIFLNGIMKLQRNVMTKGELNDTKSLT